jgi:hypothetical protein
MINKTIISTLETNNNVNSNINSNVNNNSNSIIKIKKIDSQHVQTVLEIMNKIIANAKRYNLKIDDIIVISERFLPENFEEHMGKCLEAYRAKDIHWNTIIDKIWDISKNERIVGEFRRRLLYKDIDPQLLLGYSQMYENIWQTFVIPLVNVDSNNSNINNCKSSSSSSIQCHRNITDPHTGVTGNVDLVAGDCIIDYKNSSYNDSNSNNDSSNNVMPDWTLQLLCYATIMRNNGKIVNSVKIFNPIIGQIYTADITEWDNKNKGNELLAYLLKKRDDKIARTMRSNIAAKCI